MLLPGHFKGITMKAVFICFAAMLVCLQAFAADFQWKKVAPYPTLSPLKRVAVGNGVVVAVGGVERAFGTGVILYSTDDGLNWQEAKGYAPSDLRNLVFGNGRFVAVGGDNRIHTSTDGKLWTTQTVGTGHFNLALFGNGVFIAGNEAGEVARSENGVDWTIVPGVSTQSITHGVFAAGNFTITEFTTLISSTDGITWTRTDTGIARNIPLPSRITLQMTQNPDIAYGNGAYLLEPSYSYQGWMSAVHFYRSPDAVTWTPVSGPGTGTFVEITFVEGAFRAYSGSNIHSSDDGYVWRVAATPLTVGALARGNGAYVAVGDEGSIARGPTVESLARVDSIVKNVDILAMASDGSRTVLAPGLFVSPDNGKHIFPGNPPDGLSSWVRHANGQFMAFGYGIVRSSDGLNWVRSEVTPTGGYVQPPINDVAYGSGKWVAVGLQGVSVSTDGGVFTRLNATDITLYGVAYGEGRFVAVGASGAILTSTDGSNWSLEGTNEGSVLSSVAYGNGKFVAVGEAGRAYWSDDGQTWTLRRIIGANNLPRVAFGGGLFATVDLDTSRVYLSTDALVWTQANVQDGVVLKGVDFVNGAMEAYGRYGSIYRLRAGPDVKVSIAENRAQLTLESPTEATYRIFSANTLTQATTWTDLGAVVVGPVGSAWEDPQPAGDARFYRIERQ